MMRCRRAICVAVLAIGAMATACSGEQTTSSVAQGERLATRLGCRSCHTVDGRSAIGPTWLGVAGSSVALEDGTTVVADSNYLRQSILQPGARRVAGFSTEMPVVKLSADELAALVAYLESLR